MKTIYLFLFFIILFASGCDPNDTESNRDLKLPDGFSIVSNNQVALDYNDFDYYDYSSHLIYLKDNLSFTGDIESLEEFTVYAEGVEIYSGLIRPSYTSWIPPDPFIWTEPSGFGDYVLPITFFRFFDSAGNPEPDPREDERIEKSLKSFSKFRGGLSCDFASIQYTSPTHVAVELTLTNNDPVNYYYLDPDKMGMQLFHYFTTGLTIWDLDPANHYFPDIYPTAPDPQDSWKKEWLSLIQGHETQSITLVYDDFEFVPQGEYKALFRFPGLSYQVDKEDLDQIDGRIWLGELMVFGEVVVD